jgi:peptidoglycan/LPS O-acetylase OafA/YrhL
MQSKLEQIQGIRALAILSVFITHTAAWLTDDLGWFGPVANRIGGAGVVAFFMLSGFLTSYKNVVIPTYEKGTIIKSAWRKVSKMYGLYLITMLVAFLSNFPSSSLDWTKAAISIGFDLTLTQAFIPFSWVINSFNGPAWFLSALFGIWIIVYTFPNFINRLNSLPTRRIIVVLIALLVIQWMWLDFAKRVILPQLCKVHYIENWYVWLVYNNPVFCFSEFCAGLLIGKFCLQKQYSVALQNIIAFVTLFLFVVYFACLAMRMKVFVPWNVIIECIVCLGLIAVISPNSIGYNMLSTGALVWMGNISGFFYLIHGATNFAMRVTIASYIPKPWTFFVSLITSLLLSAVADFYYNGLPTEKCKR